VRLGRRALGALLSGIVALGAPGCAAPPTMPPIAIPEDVKQLSDLIGYYSRVAAMQPEDQRREYAGASQTFSRDPSPYNRIRVALLASMPGTSFQDDVRAMSLLEPYSRAGPAYDKLRQFGAILHAQLVEGAKARGRADQFKEQLEALRAVERTIIERGQPAPPAKQ
jgi:hypothetical protein